MAENDETDGTDIDAGADIDGAAGGLAAALNVITMAMELLDSGREKIEAGPL